MKQILALIVAMIAAGCAGSPSASSGGIEPPPKLQINAPIVCEGRYPVHLQGVCMDDRQAIYWSWTNAIVKTDLKGKLLKKVDAPSHQGDLCHHDGRIYVAVNLGQFNEPAGKADSWIYVYDCQSLNLLARHPVPQAVHGAGGMAYHDGRFLVVGGLPEGVNENYLYEYDERFQFIARHVLAGGHTQMGIQTAAFASGSWWLGCYGQPKILLRADRDFKLTGKWEFDASVGILGLPDGRFLIAKSPGKKGVGHTGSLHLARPDENAGLVPLP